MITDIKIRWDSDLLLSCQVTYLTPRWCPTCSWRPGICAAHWWAWPSSGTWPWWRGQCCHMRSEVVGCQSLQDQVLIINCFASQSRTVCSDSSSLSCLPGWLEDWRNVNRGHFTERSHTRRGEPGLGVLTVSLQLTTTNNSGQQLILTGRASLPSPTLLTTSTTTSGPSYHHTRPHNNPG